MKGERKMTKLNEKYYVNVAKLMKKELPRPRLKRTIICDKDEWLPLITVECET